MDTILSWYGVDTAKKPANNGIKAMQQALIDRGLLTGRVSGVLDARTKKALMQLQTFKGLEATGKVDAKTLIALYYDE